MAQEPLILDAFLPYRLSRIADAVSRDFSQIYRDRHGMTRPEWRTLATLGQFGEMTATAIGRHSSMHKTKVSRAISALETRRWVARRLIDADRRSEYLMLTALGRKTYLTLVPIAKEFERKLLERLGPRDQATVVAALSLLERIVAEPADG